MKPLFLAKLSIAFLVPIALGSAYAVGTDPVTGRAGIAMASETASVEASMTTAVQAMGAAHRIARAKCEHLGGVDRGNCRTEARAQAKRALAISQGTKPRA